MDVFTQYAYNDTVFDNGTGSYNETEQDRGHQYNYYAMLLTLLIFVIVFGNVLVCMAVSREKALQTTTNYLIVSLAVADLLVATLVMPWVVYLEVSRRTCTWFHTRGELLTSPLLDCALSISTFFFVSAGLETVEQVGKK